jgi:hypothetical protein
VAFLEYLATTPYSDWVQASWGWAWALTIHAFGNATVVGLAWIIALRIWGFFRSVPITSLKTLFPVIWIGVAAQVYSGVTLWISKPHKYVTDWVFDTKFACVVLGAVLTVIFQRLYIREAANWQANGVSKDGKKWVTAMAIAWGMVTVMGRLTAYLGQLYGGG